MRYVTKRKLIFLKYNKAVCQSMKMKLQSKWKMDKIDRLTVETGEK